MLVTQLSMINALLFSNAFIFCFVLLSKKKQILANTSLKVFGLIIGLLILRIIFPIEFTYTKEIESFSFVPKVISLLNTEMNAQFSVLPSLTVGRILLIIWISGSIIILSKKVFSYRYMVKHLKEIQNVCNDWQLNLLEEIKQQNNYNFEAKLLISTSVPSIMEFGFFKQTILLPEHDYSEKELHYILSHELNHFANKTNWFKLVLVIAAAILWWNPLVLLFVRACNDLLEVYCDRGVTETLSLQERKGYIMCILSNIRRQNCKIDHYNLASYFTSRESTIKSRIELVMEHKRNKKAEHLVIGSIISLFLFSYCFVIQPAYQPIEIDSSSLLNADDITFQLIYENGLYVLYHDDEPFIEFNDINELKALGIKNYKE